MVASDAVLVTRPAGQAERLCAGLTAAGYRPVHFPLLEVSPVIPLEACQRRIVGALEDYDHCLFVSSNAARFGLESLMLGRSGWPGSVHCYAVGDSTADVLRAAGLSVSTPGVDMTSEGLLALPPLQAVAGQQVLIVKGEGGRTALREVLVERGARVDELRCYRRSAPDTDPRILQRLLREESVSRILISSGESLDNLMALLQQVEDMHARLADVALVVPSQRIAEQAREAGWRMVLVAANASDDAMLAALQHSMSVRGEAGD